MHDPHPHRQTAQSCHHCHSLSLKTPQHPDLAANKFQLFDIMAGDTMHCTDLGHTDILLVHPVNIACQPI